MASRPRADDLIPARPALAYTNYPQPRVEEKDLKVASLDAISANLGTMTAGTILAAVIVASDKFTSSNALFDNHLTVANLAAFLGDTVEVWHNELKFRAVVGTFPFYGNEARIALETGKLVFYTKDYDSGTHTLQKTCEMDNNGDFVLSGKIKLAEAAFLVHTTVALTNGAGASGGTLTNSPAAGDPTKWIAIDDNGTTRYIPAW